MLFAIFLVIVVCVGCTSATESPASSTSDTPLADFLGTASLQPSPEVLHRDAEAVEEFVADCMAQRGFDYVPFVSPNLGMDGPPTNGEQTLEYAEKFGYGITTLGEPISTPGPLYEREGDPNAEIIEQMSNSERFEYDVALIGFSGISDIELPAGSVPPPSCRLLAQEHVELETPQYDIDEADLAQFNDIWAALDTRMGLINLDARLVESVARWSSCMAEAGFPGLATKPEAQEAINIPWAAMNGYSLITDSDGFATFNILADGPLVPDPEKWLQLSTLERKSAVADFNCSHEYEGIWRDLRVETEIQFIEDFRAELEQWRLLINSGE